MYTRGVSRGGVSGIRTSLRKTSKGNSVCNGAILDPVLHIHPGDRVVVETVDAFEGVIKRKRCHRQKLVMPFVNPQCGPILVEGAEKGDVVAIYIQSIAPRGHNPRGTVCLIPEIWRPYQH